jgi:hypothetical protein
MFDVFMYLVEHPMTGNGTCCTVTAHFATVE